MNKNRHSSAIDLLRFLFAMSIALFHFNNVVKLSKKFFYGGSLAVEFFFMLSGYLMAVSASRHSSDEPLGSDTRKFIGRKIARLVPEYYVAWFSAFVISELLIRKGTLTAIAQKLFTSLPELLFLSESGLATQKSLQVTWYISAMLLVMLAVYPLLCLFPDFCLNIAAPALTAGLLAFGLASFKNLSGGHYLIFGLFFKTLYRALMGICAGCVIYRLSQLMKKADFKKPVRIILSVLEIALYGAVFYYYAVSGHVKADYAIFVVTALALLLTVSGATYSEAICSRAPGLCGWLGRLSLSLYLAHGHWIKILSFFKGYSGLSLSLQLLIYLAVCLMAGVATMYFCDLLRLLWKKHRGKLMDKLIASENTDGQ